MKKCRDIEHLLPLYPEGILTDAEKRAVEEHLADCAACRKELAYLQKAGQLVHRLSPVESPPWLEQKIMSGVRREADKKSASRKWFYPLRFRIPLQIAATIVIAVLAVYIYRSGDEQVKEILPGAQKPVVEMQKEQPPGKPQKEEKVLPSRRPEPKAAVRKETKEDKQMTGGGVVGGTLQKREAPQKTADVVSEVDASRAKGLAESKDKAAASLSAEQNEAAAARAPAADQERKAALEAWPAPAKKRESYKMAAPPAPQSLDMSQAASWKASVSIQVDDPNAALAKIEEILASHGAQNISRQTQRGAFVVRAEMSKGSWKDVLAKLKALGPVQEKSADAGSGRFLQATIEIIAP
ncbi:MAG: DUF2275 domain-containing protein [Deltaproteobacteria bacterium]|nr:DUF2275 domain-containing protein [Deltaproteobacteria bacterium]